MKLTLEYNQNVGDVFASDMKSRIGAGVIMITPDINKDYWLFRVKVSETQAVIAFPKFGTLGIGFQVETDWNTNLPYTCTAEEILNHISENKGDDSIEDSTVIYAITMLQEACKRVKAG